MAITRRELLRNGWKVGGTLLTLTAGWTSWELLRPLTAGEEGGKINVGAASNFPEGTATYVPQGRFWVANAGGTVFALSQKCPHLGCRIPYCESSGRFECPCHRSVFDLGGEWIGGPSPRGMDRHPVTLDADNLIVDTSVHKDGPDQGATTYLTPAKGPACVDES